MSVAAAAGAESSEAWVERHREVVEDALRVFLDTGEWPKVTDLRRHFAQLGRIIDVQEVVDSKPRHVGEIRPMYQESLSLRVRQLRYMPEGQSLVAITLAALQRAVEVYLTKGAVLKVDSSDPAITAAAAGDHRALLRAGGFLMAEQSGPFAGGGTREDGWDCWINEGLILDFQGVTTADEFVERQDQIAERYAGQSPLAAGMTHIASDKPLSIFVIMPFGPDWAPGVYDMIKRAAAAVDISPPLRVVRADGITHPGRISYQIMAAIETADVIVADISGLNPNVMWEVGFAHALGKNVVILNQDIESSPFDLLDHRQIKYSNQSEATEADVVDYLRSALAVE